MNIERYSTDENWTNFINFTQDYNDRELFIYPLLVPFCNNGKALFSDGKILYKEGFGLRHNSI